MVWQEGRGTKAPSTATNTPSSFQPLACGPPPARCLATSWNNSWRFPRPLRGTGSTAQATEINSNDQISNITNWRLLRLRVGVAGHLPVRRGQWRRARSTGGPHQQMSCVYLGIPLLWLYSRKNTLYIVECTHNFAMAGRSKLHSSTQEEWGQTAGHQRLWARIDA